MFIKYVCWLLVMFIHYKTVFPKRYFKFIKRKHGKDICNILRPFEGLKTKLEKTKLDIKYIKLCKQEHLLPTFSTVRLSIQTKNNKLKNRIGRIVMEHELESKHHEKKLLSKEIESLSIQIKMPLSLMVYSVLSNRINIAIKSRVKVIKLGHNKKICYLHKQHSIDKLSKTKPPKM